MIQINKSCRRIKSNLKLHTQHVLAKQSGGRTGYAHGTALSGDFHQPGLLMLRQTTWQRLHPDRAGTGIADMYRVRARKYAALETQKWPTDRENFAREYEDIGRTLIRLETCKFRIPFHSIPFHLSFHSVDRETIPLISMPKCTNFTRRCHSRSRLLPGRAASLHARLVQPLQDSLSAVQRLFLVPDGELHLLPFEVLSDGAPLGGAYEISYLSSGRGHRIKPGFGDVVVFANPDIPRQRFAGRCARCKPTAGSAPLIVAQLEQTRSLSLRRSATHIGDVDAGASCRPLPAPRQKRKTINARCLMRGSILGSAATRAGTV